MLIKTSSLVDPDLVKRCVDELPKGEGKLILNQPTGLFFHDPWTVKEQYKNTVWESVLSTIEHPIGEARIIILKPGECYRSHSDIDDRLHLNIQTDNSYIIQLDYPQKMFPIIKDCYWYEMNAGPRHTAANFGSVPRIQLVVRKLLPKIDNLSPCKIYPISDVFNIRHLFDHYISPWLNQQVKANRISYFSLDAETQGVKLSMDTVAYDQIVFILEELSKEGKNYFKVEKIK